MRGTLEEEGRADAVGNGFKSILSSNPNSRRRHGRHHWTQFKTDAPRVTGGKRSDFVWSFGYH